MLENLNAQKVWGWKIVVYLFLAGIGAGAYVMSLVFSLFYPEFIIVGKAGVALGAPFVFVGMFFLIWDLGNPTNAVRAFYRPVSSWISRGTLIITIFIVLGAVHIGTWVWPFTVLDVLPEARLALSFITAAFAVMTLIYTALLLSASRPISFWSTAILPVLFLVSGVFTGAMATALYSSAVGLSIGHPVGQPLATLAQYGAVLIIVEALVLFFYLQGMHQLTSARASAWLLVKGGLAPRFWGGVVAAGLAVPFAVEVVAFFYLPTADPATAFAITAIASILGLAGGLLLKQVVIAGGTKMPLNVQGIMVPLRSNE